MNITPINTCAYTQNRTNNSVNAQKQNTQSFGVKITPNMETLTGLLKNYKADTTAQFAIPYYLSKTLDEHFNDATLTSMVEQALHNGGQRLKGITVKEVMPDIEYKSIPLKFNANEEGLRGELGNHLTEAVAQGEIISDRKWVERGIKDSEIFFEPIKKMAEKYIERLIAMHDINRKNY